MGGKAKVQSRLVHEAGERSLTACRQGCIALPAACRCRETPGRTHQLRSKGKGPRHRLRWSSWRRLRSRPLRDMRGSGRLSAGNTYSKSSGQLLFENLEPDTVTGPVKRPYKTRCSQVGVLTALPPLLDAVDPLVPERVPAFTTTPVSTGPQAAAKPSKHSRYLKKVERSCSVPEPLRREVQCVPSAEVRMWYWE